MRILTCFLFLLCCGLPLVAQDAPPSLSQREIGLRLSGLNTFGFIYKRQVSDFQYRRVRVASGALSVRSGGNIGLDFNVAFGKEKRQPLGSDFFFHHGAEPFLGAAINGREQRGSRVTIFQLTGGLGYVVGFQKYLSDELTIGIESIPAVSLAYSANNVASGSDILFQAGFNANAVALTITYAFLR